MEHNDLHAAGCDLTSNQVVQQAWTCVTGGGAGTGLLILLPLVDA